MAIAERRLAFEFNRPGHEIIDHRTYLICSDGDLQEGVTAEASSLAGHLRLGKLIALYDDNRIQLDGPTAWAFTEDVLKRYEAYGWHTQRVEDGNDAAAIDAAIEAAKADDRPSMIAVRTHIGYGSPNKQDTQKAHGAPLGPDEVRLTKEAYGWDPDKQFFIPEEAAAVFRRSVDEGREACAAWDRALEAYAGDHPAEAAELKRRVAGRLAEGWDANLTTYETGTEVATRNASQDVIQALAGPVPELFGGSADLSESNLTDVKANGHDHFSADHPGRNLRFGVREHAMGGIVNGIDYHGGFLPYGATFLTFSDYMRGAVRLAALSELHVIYVWTHDSVGLGEDGPTHQPVEHYAALRAIPNLWFVRPGDANETVAAWALAVERPAIAGAQPGPVALALTRQKLPTLPGTIELAREGVRRGGYVLREAGGGRTAELILIGTGSELQLAFHAAEALEADGIPTRVVSLPCWERFEAQDQAYRESVLPAGVRKRVTVEAGVSMGWERYAGDQGAIIGIDHFGASAPARDDLQGVRVHRGSGRGRRAAGRARGPPRPDQDAGRRPRRAPHARDRRPGRRPDALDRPRARLRHADARRVRRRPCRGRVQGRAAAQARGPDRGPARADRPGRRRLRPPGRLPGLLAPPRARDPGGPRGPRDPDLRLGRGRVDRRQQDARHAGRAVPRHVQRAPGRRARRHERADAGGAGDRHRAGGGVLAGVPGRDVLRRAAAPAAAGQGAGDRGGVHGPRRVTGGGDGDASGEDVLATITAANHAYARAFAASDADALLALFEPDGGIVDGSARDALGHDQLREMLAWGAANLRDVEFAIDTDWAKLDGLDPRTAHAAGRWRIAYVPADGPQAGTTVRERGTFAETWRRGPDGSWRIHRDLDAEPRAGRRED